MLRPPELAGKGTATVRKILGDNTKERILFEQAIVGERGGNNNPEGSNQWSEVNHDNVMVDQKGSIASQGNSIGYAARRLADADRHDLIARVEAGEMTWNAAMIEAGFRKPTITLPI